MNRASSVPNDSGGSSSGTSSSSGKEPKASTNVQVAVRCRPPNADEKKSGQPLVVTNDQEARTVAASYGAPGKKFSKNFTFDKVFGMYSTQDEVFKGIVKPIVQEVLEGFNCTIFAYGQTGTGKTHTMQGDIHCEENAGIVPRAVKDILEQLEESGVEFTIRVSFLELYNEELQDLLSTSPPVAASAAPGPMSNAAMQAAPKLKLCEDSKKGSVVCQGLEEVTVLTVKDIFDILERGIQQRQTAETLCNKNSSRSHSIFTLKINIREYNPDGEEVVRHGQLNLVDLAGSECIGRSGAKNDRAREAGTINQSLLSLGRVITALVDHHSHIPYRDSKLTRLLQDSLGGKAKTCIIATFSPSSSAIEETLSTLDYASRAKNIKNQPQQNQKMTKKVVLKEYCAEIEQLKTMLQMTREKNGIYVDPETYYAMEAKVANQEAQLTECEGALKRMGEEVKTFKAARDDLQDELDGVKTVLGSTVEKLEATTAECAEVRGELAVKVTELAASDAVVTEQAVCEATLHNQGAGLITEVTDRRGDINALLGKVDRFVGKERERVANTAAFMQRMQASQRQLAGGVDALSQHCGAHSTSLCGGVQEMLAQGKDSCAVLKAAIDKALEALLQDGRDATGSMSETCDGLAAELTQASAHIATTLQGLQSQLSSWLGDVDGHISASNGQLKMQQDEIANLKGNMEKALQAQTDFVAAFVRDNGRLSAQCTADVEALRAEVTTQLQQMQASNSQQMHTAADELESKAAALKLQFASMMDDMVRANGAAMLGAKTSVETQCAQAVKTLTAGTDKVGQHVGAMTTAAAAAGEKLPHMLEHSHAAWTQQVDTVQQHGSSAAEACATVGNSVVARRAQLDETVSALVGNVQESIQERAISAAKSTSATAAALYGKIEGTTTAMEQGTTASLREFNELLHGKGDALEAELKDHFAVVDTFCGQEMKAAALPELQASVAAYSAQMGDAVLQPTGSTPQKATCAANNSKPLPALSSTRDHGAIRSEVREGCWVPPSAVSKVPSVATFAAVEGQMEAEEQEEATTAASSTDTSAVADENESEAAEADVMTDVEAVVQGRQSTDSVSSVHSAASTASSKSTASNSNKRSSTSSKASTEASDSGSKRRKFGSAVSTNANAAEAEEAVAPVSKASKIAAPPAVAPAAEADAENAEAANPFTAAVTATPVAAAATKTRSARSGIAKPSTRTTRTLR